jgi:hypothetical protein
VLSISRNGDGRGLSLKAACPSQQDRKHHQADLVDQAVLDQGVLKLAAAVDKQLAPPSLFRRPTPVTAFPLSTVVLFH